MRNKIKIKDYRLAGEQGWDGMDGMDGMQGGSVEGEHGAIT